MIIQSDTTDNADSELEFDMQISVKGSNVELF